MINVESHSVRITFENINTFSNSGYQLRSIYFIDEGHWRQIIGDGGFIFSTSQECENGHDLLISSNKDEILCVTHASTPSWHAVQTLKLHPFLAQVHRTQTWHFTSDWEGAIHPGWSIPIINSSSRYTFPLQTHETPLTELKPLRADVNWALPFPFHILHTDSYILLAGPLRTVSPGTIDLIPDHNLGQILLRTYYPDQTQQPVDFSGIINKPETAVFRAGSELTIEDILWFQHIHPNEDPLLEAVRMGASLLLNQPLVNTPDIHRVTERIVDFYHHCDLWEPDAFGTGKGWFLNMWIYTEGGVPQKYGPAAGFFDMGWGEGIMSEFFVAAVRYWKRTGRQDLLPYLKNMSASLYLFRRPSDPVNSAAYYDRSDGSRFMDFCQRPYIWLSSLGHTGNQLLTAFLESGEDFPDQDSRTQWLLTARSIASFCAHLQTPDGDLPDVIDENNHEVNPKSRIPARVVIAGLWVNLANLTGDKEWLLRAQKLARYVSSEIMACDFTNQMQDALDFAQADIYDGEAAYYALEGLVPLAETSNDPKITALCRRAAAFGFLWTYFYNVPKAYRGIARGGQCCRSNDYPLVYPIGPAKAIEPVLRLWRLTGDILYHQMAHEMAVFIANYQIDAPGKPWDGGIVHASEQYSGLLWGPDKLGQVDSGMATGNSLAALEYWLREAV